MRVLSAYLILGVFLSTLATCRARPRALSAPDYDDYRDEPFDPNWVHNSDTLDIPPCPGWNPIDGCGRTPARTKPPGPTSEPTERTSPPAPDYLKQHEPYQGRLPCTPEEEKKAACLHGGTCFVMNMRDTRAIACQCGEIWAGRRCERLDESRLDSESTAQKIKKALIIAGVVVFLIIITVIIIICVVVKKRKQRKLRSQENGNANGHAGKAPMSSDKENIECEETVKSTDV